MNIQGGLLVAVWSAGLIAVWLATWAACRWWYGRKLLAAAHRLHQSDKGRLFSQQQALQARRQVELLRAELTASRAAAVVSASTVAAERVRELQASLLEAERLLPIEPARRPPAGPSGFADTQIMS